MSHHMRRREFLVEGGKAVLAGSLLPIAACAGRRTAPTLPPSKASDLLPRLVAHLNDRAPAWMRETSTPGVAISIIADAKPAWRGEFGVKDAASRARVTRETMFEAASMSKPVFAYVVMKLCETGRMNLDTPLTSYTPERFLDGDPRLDLITARHVLSHTTGFQNWRSDKEPLKIHFNPGERYQYSGEGYNYLQTVVTRLVGQPFERYMHARLFDPMGMRSSGYVWTDDFARRMARPHNMSGLPLDNRKSTSADVTRYGSAGALLTTTTDYTQFMVGLIDPKPADAFHLTRDGIREMLRPHVKLEGGQYPASWALGWQIFRNGDRDFIFHGGDNEGFHCHAVASVAGRSGYVAMTNGESGPSLLRNLLMDSAMQEFLLS